MQAILTAALDQGGPRYAIHPGDLAFWVFHSNPRNDTVTYWVDGECGFVVLDADNQEVSGFSVPGNSPIALLEWGRERLGANARVAYVSTQDVALETELQDKGYEVAGMSGPVFVRSLTSGDNAPRIPEGFDLRPMTGEEEADQRRRASHAAFKSTMNPGRHLERYLRFMRSPVYEAERDLVAVTPDGRVASFMIWWPDPSGIAQIEPMGTDPSFQRTGVGRALMRHAFTRMKDAGMTEVRVLTDDHRRDAVAFYTALGFTRVADLRFWKPSAT